LAATVYPERSGERYSPQGCYSSNTARFFINKESIMAKLTPWAFILFKFADDDSEPNPREFYEQLFTAAGRGTHNIVDYWESVSHRHLDLSSSEVIGWVTVEQTLQQWRADQAQLGSDITNLEQLKASQASQELIDMAQAAVQAGFKKLRYDVMQQVKRAAIQADYDLTKYYGVVAVSNVTFDLWGSFSEVLISGAMSDLSGLAHEMGHGYGLLHSMDRRYVDYTDWWDVMSYAACATTSFPDHGLFTSQCGPVLNAANMERLGWLDAARVFVWNRNSDSGHQTIQLTALTSPDRPGFIAAKVEQFLVEFRFPESWDAGIPRPCVMVHTHEMARNSGVLALSPILQSSSSGRQDAQVGDVFHVMEGATDPRIARFFEYLAIRVDGIDVENRVATISIIYQAASRQFEAQPTIQSWIIPGMIGVGVNGEVIPVPPRQEMQSVITDSVLNHLVNDVESRLAAKLNVVKRNS
jgi:M6 family metalloprotease-like protein